MYEQNTVTGANTNANSSSGQNQYNSSAYYYGGNQIPPEPAKKKGKGTFKKILFSGFLGVLFGTCAGFCFYGVTTLTGAMQAAKNEVEAISSNQYVAEVAPTIQDIEDTKKKEVKHADTEAEKIVANDVSAVVDEVMPAMVSIKNTGTEVTNFWGQSYSRETSSSGSGIIIGEKDGELLIVTNHHVATGADTLEVTFINGSTARAYAKGMDSEMDLAVISVDKSSLEAETIDAISIATLGDSDDLKLGKPVIVIGNALGYGQSVTNGIISGLNRELTMEDGSTGTFIQTNAAVNPGNSGGALLNIDGEVIGIVSSKIGGSAIEGMGYAIPISSASPIISDLMEHRTKVGVADEEKAGYLGVALRTVNDIVINYYGMPAGAYVEEVVDGEAADKAGIRPRDIIVKFEGEKITATEEVLEQLQYYEAGETVTITISRQQDGEYVEQDIQVVLGNRPKQD